MIGADAEVGAIVLRYPIPGELALSGCRRGVEAEGLPRLEVTGSTGG